MNNYSRFVDRREELRLLNAYADQRGLLIVLGRRRVGKTSLLKKWISRHNGIYSQAIESSSEIQLAQTAEDLATKISLAAAPKSWLELSRLLDASGERRIVCLDEFQYLIKGDPSLPSILQKWLDHENRSGSLIVLAGSSMKVMREACLTQSSPLYGRALQIINLAPISYEYFAQYLNLSPKHRDTFALYTLVGGMPKYWEYLRIIKKIHSFRRLDPSRVIDDLYFSSSPFMEGEVSRLLSDEKIEGVAPLSVLEAIGRGSHRPSEIAARLGVPQTQLSKVFDQLVTSKLVHKETPFGSSEKNNKLVKYVIIDPAILSSYNLASAHRSRWSGYSDTKKVSILTNHYAQVFEQYVRASLPSAQRFWNSQIEVDLVYQSEDQLHFGEVKWSKLSIKQVAALLAELKGKAIKSGFVSQSRSVILEVYDQTFLKTGKPYSELLKFSPNYSE